jgi:hypothetical protein
MRIILQPKKKISFARENTHQNSKKSYVRPILVVAAKDVISR